MDGGAGATDISGPISAAFGSCASFVIDRLEGGSALITDTGGETRWGISKRAHPDVDIAHLTRFGALAIYHDRYWRVIHGDLLPRGLDLAIYDLAVNQGPSQAVRTLQRVLRLAEDGIMGPLTLKAAKAYRPQSELRAQVNELRLRSYEAIAQTRPATHAKYLFGWRMRVMRVADEAGRVGGQA